MTRSRRVKIAAHHLNKLRGVLIGDVVGLGKTLMTLMTPMTNMLAAMASISSSPSTH
jgi:hypothetical protein